MFSVLPFLFPIWIIIWIIFKNINILNFNIISDLNEYFPKKLI
mgnify:CR=1 FL=1